MSAPAENGIATPYINVTPLIDVLLVLLIIFMVVTPLKPSRFKTLIPTPPKEEEVVPHINDEGLRVDISSDLRLKLNGDEMGSVGDTRELASKLADVFQKRAEAGLLQFGTDRVKKTVYVKAPRSIRYGEVVKVIDGIKGAGADPVGLQVDDLQQ